MPDLWTDAMDLRAGLRCMQSAAASFPYLAPDYRPGLERLRRSRWARHDFLTKLRANPQFQILRRHFRQVKTTP